MLPGGMATRAEEGPQGQRLRRTPTCRSLVGERIGIGRLGGAAVVAVVQTATCGVATDAVRPTAGATDRENGVLSSARCVPECR